MPLTNFSEYESTEDGKAPVWFALEESRPLMFFPGLWTEWTSVRKMKEGETTNDLYGSLTTTPNDVVAEIHPKAMPVILTERDELDVWMPAPVGGPWSHSGRYRTGCSRSWRVGIGQTARRTSERQALNLTCGARSTKAASD